MNKILSVLAGAVLLGATALPAFAGFIAKVPLNPGAGVVSPPSGGGSGGSAAWHSVYSQAAWNGGGYSWTTGTLSGPGSSTTIPGYQTDYPNDRVSITSQGGLMTGITPTKARVTFYTQQGGGSVTEAWYCIGDDCAAWTSDPFFADGTYTKEVTLSATYDDYTVMVQSGIYPSLRILDVEFYY